MVHDKIALVLKDVSKLKDKLKEVKKDMKQEEVVSTEDYIQLKAAYKSLRMQVKDIEEAHKQELADDDFYNQLRELRLKTEEELALANEKLFDLVADLPQKFMEMDVETEGGRVKVQIQPEMRLYMNGKEEKQRRI